MRTVTIIARSECTTARDWKTWLTELRISYQVIDVSDLPMTHSERVLGLPILKLEGRRVEFASNTRSAFRQKLIYLMRELIRELERVDTL